MLFNFGSNTTVELMLNSLTGVSLRPIPRDEYFSLALGRRPLERCDDPDHLQRGLLDRKSRELFVISDRELLRG